MAAAAAVEAPPDSGVTTRRLSMGQVHRLLEADPAMADSLWQTYQTRFTVATDNTVSDKEQAAAAAASASRQFEIWVATNEPHHADLRDRVQALGTTCVCQSGSKMVIADFWFMTPGGRVMQAVERKRIDDLVSGIKTLRLYDEVDRMLKSDIPMLVILVTGSLLWITNRIDRDAATSMINHLTLLEPRRLRVQFVSEDGLIPEWLHSQMRYLKMYYHGDEWFTALPEVEDTKRKCKKRHLDQQADTYFAQLCMTFKMSPRYAEVIVGRYPSWSHLIEAYRSCYDDKQRRQMLADLQIPTKRGFQRLGDALSQRLYETTIRNNPPAAAATAASSGEVTTVDLNTSPVAAAAKAARPRAAKKQPTSRKRAAVSPAPAPPPEANKDDAAIEDDIVDPDEDDNDE